MLILVATPIGNLKDITLRAIETLKAVDLILCEDTRLSSRLLKEYGISKPLLSFHKFNEREREDEILSKLKEGQEIALISDAGTPGICDPGAKLIKRCHEEGLAVTAIPGPSALIMALSLFGGEERKFQFTAFMPKKEGELKKRLLEMLLYDGLTIAYESPHRLMKTLKMSSKLCPDCEIFIARELTKIYEECLRGTPEQLSKHFQEKGVKGELVLIFSGGHQMEEGMTPLEYVDYLIKTFQIDKKEAIKLAANQLNLPKRMVYKDLMSI